jgi:hypothetical protein
MSGLRLRRADRSADIGADSDRGMSTLRRDLFQRTIAVVIAGTRALRSARQLTAKLQIAQVDIVSYDAHDADAIARPDPESDCVAALEVVPSDDAMGHGDALALTSPEARVTWDITTPTRRYTESTSLDTRGPKRLWDAPAGRVTRERGAVGRLVQHDYLCPVHGRFEASVPSSDVPDTLMCPVLLTEPGFAIHEPCSRSSPWSPSTFGIWPSSGETAS